MTPTAISADTSIDPKPFTWYSNYKRCSVHKQQTQAFTFEKTKQKQNSQPFELSEGDEWTAEMWNVLEEKFLRSTWCFLLLP